MEVVGTRTGWNHGRLLLKRLEIRSNYLDSYDGMTSGFLADLALSKGSDKVDIQRLWETADPTQIYMRQLIPFLCTAVSLQKPPGHLEAACKPNKSYLVTAINPAHPTRPLSSSQVEYLFAL